LKVTVITLGPSFRTVDYASSAGRQKSSRDLDSQASGDRDRRNKQEEFSPALMVIVAVDERFHERSWENSDLDRRQQPTAGDFPERRLRKLFSPEDLPSRDGPPIGAEEPGEFGDSAWRGPLSHGGDENNDGAEINLPAEKPHRRWRDSLTAPVAVATEAEPALVWFWQMVGAAWLSGVVGAVQSPATRARILASGLGEVLVDGKKKQPKAGIAGQTG
jgi:hypothetical protein